MLKQSIQKLILFTGDSSFCLNFGGGDSTGGEVGSRNFMAMFGSGGDDQEEENGNTEGDSSFTFNFGSSVTSSDSAPTRFSLF